jgi:hypothetical protein
VGEVVDADTGELEGAGAPATRIAGDECRSARVETWSVS